MAIYQTTSDETLESLEQASLNSPRDYMTLVALSRGYFKKERYAEAISALDKAQTCDPLDKEFQDIQQAIRIRFFVQARDIALKILQQVPNHPRAVFTLHNIHQMRGEHEQSHFLLKGALETYPADLSLRKDYIKTCEDCGFFEEAVQQAKRLIEIKENALNFWLFMNVALRYGLYEEVLVAANKALHMTIGEPMRQSELYLFQGHAHRILGHSEKAISSYKESLSLNPKNGSTWWALADLKTYRFSDIEQDKMRQLGEDEQLHPLQKSQVAFALAKSVEQTGGPKAALSIYTKANALHPAGQFNSQEFESAVVRIIQAFSKKTLSKQAAVNEDAPTPIFILGLPRSGSTLIEQILSSHSQIEGTLELLALPSVKREAHKLCEESFGGHYLDKIDQLSETTLEQLGQSYLDRAEFFRKEGRCYFIDKLPHNFEHIGLIHKILPQSVIIDARRNPMDCGYSLFKQFFSAGSGFSYDLGSIGCYYKGYLKLMDHWEAVLPGRVFRVQYEMLISQTESVIRDLLNHIGLEFETSCLEFHINQRAVRTASSEQVRQPIYKTAFGAWRELETELLPLKEALGPQVLARTSQYWDG